MIFPDLETAGAVIVRDAAGNPVAPSNDVQNAYVPPPEYVATCPISALPADCDARIEAKQINAIVSELLSFAECLDPDGPWTCDSVKNLCAAFAVWVEEHILDPIIISDTPPAEPRPGLFWYESSTGALFLYYADSDSQAWVQLAPGNGINDGVTIVGAGTTSSPHSVGHIDCGSW